MAQRPLLAEVREADARGEIAELYADIRATIGVAMVNLVFRNMATVPGCLAWAWAHLKPLYRAGLVADRARALVDDPAAALELSFAASDVSATDAPPAAVAAVGRSYARANPMNLIGLGVIEALLDEDDASRRRRPAAAPVARAVSNEVEQLVPMVDLATAPDAVRARLATLARQLHQGDNGVIPSLYRHFGAWPKLLDLIAVRLEPRVADGTLFAVAAAMEQRGTAAAAALHTVCPKVALPPPAPAAASALRDLIATFPANICRMTLVARALARIVPAG
jgi:hypothetical protein